MEFEWKKEILRDLMAFGSWPFLILVLVRVWMTDNFLQMFQITFGVVLLFFLGLFWKGLDEYAGRIVILVVFTSLFYYEVKFTFFAVFIGVLGIFGMWKYLERKGVFIGVLIGGVVSLISYFVSGFTGIENL